MICSNCATQNQSNDKFCRSCGNPLENKNFNDSSQEFTCFNCGNARKQTDKFCVKCGFNYEAVKSTDENPNVELKTLTTSINSHTGSDEKSELQLNFEDVKYSRHVDGQSSYRCINGHRLLAISEENFRFISEMRNSPCPECNTHVEYEMREYYIKATSGQRNYNLWLTIISVGLVYLFFFILDAWWWTVLAVIFVFAAFGGFMTFLNGNAYEFKFGTQLKVSQDWSTKIEIAVDDILLAIVRDNLGNSIPPDQIAKGGMLAVMNIRGKTSSVKFNEDDFMHYKPQIIEALQNLQKYWKLAW